MSDPVRRRVLSSYSVVALGVLASGVLLVQAGCATGHGLPGSPPDRHVPPPEFCAQAPHDELCSFLPHDVIVNLNLGYSALDATDQRPFDNFSWQSFVALNWPANPDGTPAPGPIGTDPSAPRVWQSYVDALAVFDVETATHLVASPPACADLLDARPRPVFQRRAKNGDFLPDGSILESTGQPLIDRELNFVIFDIRMNEVEEDYITQNGLETAAGQAAFKAAGKTVSFPLGHYADQTDRTGGSVGAIELKTAWRLLVDGTDVDHPYYTTEGLVYVPPSETESGEPLCIEANLGLVGFHVIQRTTSPTNEPQDWIWSTFEHVDNNPVATNAAPPTTLDPGPVVCDPPTSPTATFAFFDPDCAGCATNQPPTGGPFKWASQPPYAAAYAIDGRFGTQVVRCRSIFQETAELNAAFQEKLAGTVWASYQLINTQWQGGIEDPTTENGNIPRFLANTTLETYIQTAANANDASSCLACHSHAKTTAGQDANFSFLLGLAQ